MKTIGEKLKDARMNAGLKQSDVAEKLDCAPTSLTNWEKDKVQPSLDVLSKLCEVYGIEPLSLLDRKYEYSDIVAISGKPVSDRTYEEQIALNFSEPILERLMLVEAQRQETKRVEETAAFIQSTNLLTRFSGQMGQAEIEAVKADYDANGTADADILFAFHALTADNKTAFLSVLSGLLSDSDNLQTWDNMDAAKAFTLDRLAKQRKEIKKG
jgi:transcriptional regulator with XRE-family HTH domain